MCIFVGDAVCGVIIYRLRLRRLLLPAAVFALRSDLLIPVHAVALLRSLLSGSVLRSSMPDCQNQLPACVSGAPSRLPDRLRPCRPGLSANNPCNTTLRVNG